ncbi:MAG: hypothetical protein ACTHZX_04450 [Microbacterium sp.]
MTRRQLLALRGSAASAVATLVAALSHSWAGGHLPPALLVVGMAVLLAVPGMALMGARPRPVRIGITVPVLQAAFHAVFTLLGAPVAGEGIAGGHDHHGAGAHLLAGAGRAESLDAGMIAAHAVAAIVTVAILLHGERAVLAVRAWAADWAGARTIVPRPRPRLRLRVARSSLVLRARLEAASARSRGPPLPCV